MADFFRPAVRRAIWRWRETILGLGVVAGGAWWIATSFAPVGWLGWVAVLGGASFAVAGLQRARFRQPGQGPGIVQVLEGRIGYFGPLTGGVLDIADLVRLELEPRALPAAHWVLTGAGGATVEIPVNAEGAEALFDAFARLPGIRTGQLLSVLDRTPDARVIVWERSRPLLH